MILHDPWAQPGLIQHFSLIGLSFLPRWNRCLAASGTYWKIMQITCNQITPNHQLYWYFSSVSVKWMQKYTHFQPLLKVSKTLRKTNEIVQSHYCFIHSTFPHPQLNVSECKLVLMGKMLSMTPERKSSWKSLSSESNWGIVFASLDTYSPSKAQQGQNIFLFMLGWVLLGFRTSGLQGWFAWFFKI